MFQKCYITVSKVYQKCFDNVSEVFQKCFKVVCLHWSHRSYPSIRRACLIYAKIRPPDLKNITKKFIRPLNPTKLIYMKENHLKLFEHSFIFIFQWIKKQRRIKHRPPDNELELYRNSVDSGQGLTSLHWQKFLLLPVTCHIE